MFHSISVAGAVFYISLFSAILFVSTDYTKFSYCPCTRHWWNLPGNLVCAGEKQSSRLEAVYYPGLQHHELETKVEGNGSCKATEKRL